MSANNVLIVDKEKDKYILADCDIETGRGPEVGSFETAKEALNAAKDYLSENLVEYGLNLTDDFIESINN